MIESYDFGHIVINGKAYGHDVMLYKEAVTPWIRETKRYLEAKGIEVIVQVTGQAYKTYNKLEQEGKNVCGAFHLTC